MSEYLQNPHQNIDEAAREMMSSRHAIVSQESGDGLVPSSPESQLVRQLLGLLSPTRVFPELPPFAQEVLNQAQSSQEGEEQQPRRFVTGNGANIRAEASTQSSSLGTIHGELEIIGPDISGQTYGSSNIWYQVRTQDNQLGFVHSSVVSEPRVEDLPLQGPDSLTRVEFPEAATNFIDGWTWQYRGQDVSIRVYTNLDDYEEHRNKFVTIDDAGWEIISRFYTEQFDHLATLPNETLQLPVYEQNRGWPANMRAADVDESGAFEFQDEQGQFYEVSLQQILNTGINIILVHEPPQPNIADEPPSASRGQIYYLGDGPNGGEPYISFKFDHDHSQGLTFYMYLGKGIFNTSGDDLRRRYFVSMISPVAILWDLNNLQTEAQERWDNDLTRIRNHIINLSWNRRRTGREQIAEYFRQNEDARTATGEGQGFVTIQPK